MKDTRRVEMSSFWRRERWREEPQTFTKFSWIRRRKAQCWCKTRRATSLFTKRENTSVKTSAKTSGDEPSHQQTHSFEQAILSESGWPRNALRF